MGCRPASIYLEQCGLAQCPGPGWPQRHFIYVRGDEAYLGKANSDHQPLRHAVNQLLRPDCCPVCDMEEAGVGNPGSASMASASNDGSNLMAGGACGRSCWQGGALWRCAPRQPQGRSSLALGLIQGESAACVARPELGPEYRSRKAADLALFKLDELRFSGARRQPLAGAGPVRARIVRTG